MQEITLYGDRECILALFDSLRDIRVECRLKDVTSTSVIIPVREITVEEAIAILDSETHTSIEG